MNKLEQLRAQLAQAEAEAAQEQASKLVVSGKRMLTWEEVLARGGTIEEWMEQWDAALPEYIASHKRCTYCLRHNDAERTECQLCHRTEFEGVTDYPASYHTSDGKRLMEALAHSSPELAYFHLWWRKPLFQVNAACFIVGEFVHSEEIRAHCKLLLGLMGYKKPSPAEITEEVRLAGMRYEEANRYYAGMSGS